MVRQRAIAVAAVLGLVLTSCSGTEDEPSIVGVWVHDFDMAYVGVTDYRDDGTVTYSMGADTDSLELADTGEYTFADGTLTFGKDTYCTPLGVQAATYTAVIEGDTVTYTVVSDDCADRKEAMDGLTFVRHTPGGGADEPKGGSSAAGEALSGEVPWWNETVFYEVFVRSFKDSDGDGIGDLRGLIDQLDYLNDGDPGTETDLGVTGLWLMPITQSPSYHGYDATDYGTVEEDYGTNQDFRDLVAAAHERGIRVIVDLMLNHTSSEHPWFAESAEGPSSPRRDWYVWRDDDPGQSTSWGSSAWHPLGGAYYLGLFWEGMPDLNYRSEAVTDQMFDVARFWLEEMGTDGFRLDAVRHLIEEGDSFDGGPATHAWLAAWDDHIDSIDPTALTVGEVWDEQADTIAAYVRDDEVDIAFAFPVAGALLDSIGDGDPAAFDAALADVLTSFPVGQFAPFLTNHDQNRVMSTLDGDVPSAKLAATAMLTLPGAPFLYYGEEIGMTGEKPDELIRTPMQWTADDAGFTSGTPWEPANSDAAEVNVTAQRDDPDSLLSHYRTLIALRSDLPVLRTGGLRALSSTCPEVYAFLRTAGDATDASALVLLNFAESEQTGCALSVDSSALAAGSYDVIDMVSTAPASTLTVGEGGAIDAYSPAEGFPARGSTVFEVSRAAG